MRRTLETVDGRPRLALSNVSVAEEEAVARALVVLEHSTPHYIESTVELLRDGFAKREVGPDAIERLSRWANTGYLYASAVGPARDVVRLLFNCVLERFIDEESRPVGDYAAQLDALMREVNGESDVSKI